MSVFEVIADGGPRRGIDRDEVLRGLAFLIDPDATHQVQALPSGRYDFVRGDDLDGAVRAVEALADEAGVYVTLNPLTPGIGRPARVGDVLSRRRLLIDCDRRKTEETKGLSSTEEEKQAAKDLAGAVLADLSARGWPKPVVIDSGNGWHLVYSIDLPNDALSRQIVSRCLKAVQAAHGTAAAEVDVKVHNANRITKLPGTWVRKGAGSRDRPHRLARLVSVPASFTPVPVELLRDLAGLANQPPPATPAPAAFEVTAADPAGGGLDAYVRKAVEAECGRVALAPAGDRNNTLNGAAFNLGRLLHLGVIGRPAVEESLTFAAARAGLAGPEIGPTVRSGLDAGAAKPRTPPARPHTFSALTSATASGGSAEQTTGHSGRAYAFRLIVRGSSVTPKKVDWLWRDRVPFGFLTLLAGRTGVGKSFVTLDLAARLSTGDEVPNGAGECFDPASALIISEDSHDFILAPRLIEAGADMGRISFMTWEAMAAFTLADTMMLDDTFEAAGSPRLVVIDPPTNFLGARDEHRNAEVRGVLMGCSVWAMRHGVACLMITHTNKGTKKDISALDRVIGSVAWASTSRIAHLLAPHPEARDQGVFLPMKTNIGRMPPGLAYAIRKTETLARVEWLGEAGVDADDAVSAAKTSPRCENASGWLVARLREKQEWPSNDLFRAAEAAGVGRNALFEAKKTLLLPKARKDGDQWVWWVPPHWEPPAQP
jgi:hypothetical protein